MTFRADRSTVPSESNLPLTIKRLADRIRTLERRGDTTGGQVPLYDEQFTEYDRIDGGWYSLKSGTVQSSGTYTITMNTNQPVNGMLRLSINGSAQTPVTIGALPTVTLTAYLTADEVTTISIDVQLDAAGPTLLYKISESRIA